MPKHLGQHLSSRTIACPKDNLAVQVEVGPKATYKEKLALEGLQDEAILQKPTDKI